MKFVLLLSSLFLFHVASGVKISCYSTDPVEWSYLGAVKTCRSGAGNDITSPNVIVDNDVVDGSIVALSFYDPGKVHYIPHGILNNYPQLKGLYFASQPLTVIREEDMQQFGSQIEYFHVNNASVTHLTKNVFRHNTHLKYLRFEHNPFQYIEPGFFESLAKMPQMLRVSFDNCKCINLGIWKTGKLLSEIPEIYEAEENKNQLQHTCNNGKQMDVIKTNVEIVFYGANYDAKCKFFVYGEDTLIGDIFGSTAGAKNIKILTIKDSVTKYIPTNFGEKFWKLTDLTFDTTGLVKVTKQSLTPELKALQRLSFANNALVNIPNDAFEYLTNLETLDLSYNSIYSFNPVVVKNLSNLKYLYLGGNEIKSIVGDFFDILPKSIQILSMQNNGCINMRYPFDGKTEITKKIKESCTLPTECQSLFDWTWKFEIKV